MSNTNKIETKYLQSLQLKSPKMESKKINSNKHQETFIPNVRSNTQFQFILQQGTEKSNKILKETLAKPFAKENRKWLAEMLAKIKLIKTDEQIYLFIHEFLNNTIYKKNKPNNEGEGRAISRSVDIEKLWNSAKDKNTQQISIYLDIGCSKGSITKSVINTLRPLRTIGFDIIDNVEFGLGFEYVKMEANKMVRFELENNSVQFATFNVSMHHIPPPILEQYLQELERVFVKGGVVIIREHDVDERNKNSAEKKILIDILHGLYSISWNLKGHMEDANFIQNYYANYNGKNYWSALFRKYGFSRVSNKLTGEYYHLGEMADNQTTSGGKIRNPFNLYWAVYRKIG
jgi:SAM-dependent methyltransferase